MSAPTPAPGDDRPREGYYPDPSIPGYVRYWNGASWVPGTSRPAPHDGEPLTPPPGVRPVTPAPAVEETGPHFFDEDPQPAPTGQQQGQRGGAGGVQGGAGAGDGRTPWGADPRVPAAGQSGPGGPTDAASNPPAQDDGPDPGGTFIFRRPVPGPAAVRDEGTMTFRPVPGQGRPGDRPAAAPDAGAGSGFGPQTPGPQTSGPGAPAAGRPGTGFVPGQAGPGAGTANSAGAPGGFGPQGPVGRATPPAAAPSPAEGPGFGAGKAAAARAAAAQPPQPPQAAQQAQAPAAVAPSVPAQGGAPAGGPGTPLTSGPGGGQASWAQQVHQLAGGGDEQPMAPWKPPVEDVFQAAARRQAAARPAGVGKRLAARLIDTLIVLAVTATAAVPLGLRAADHVQQKIDAARLSGREVTVWLLDGTTATSLGIVLAVLLLAGVAYEVVPTAKWGRTLGKRALGLEVRDIEAHEPPAFGPALRRWLVYSIPGLLGIGIVGVLWCLFDRPWHQCWHDKAAHTFVAG
ncbi:RDD family protein [Streptomyces sp. NPDC088560]|uniref:RDD family protein n=1 Tax=Streptomyces sp. NPDC088560 TaxID=3365868 RepID=UPI0038132B74